MLRRHLHTRLAVTLTLVAAAACGEDGDTPAAAPAPAAPDAPDAVELRDPEGELIVALSVTPAAGDAEGSRCAIDGPRALEVSAAADEGGGELRVTDDGAVVLTYGAGPTGPEIRDGGSRTLARVADAGARFGLLGPDGVAFFRITNSENDAVLLDRASVPIARVAHEGGRAVAKARDGAILYYVLGTDDLRLAAILAAEAAPWEQRALLGCARLLARASS